MIISFKAKTNREYCMINTAVFTDSNGVKYTIDRDQTYYDINNGVLSMEWGDCYLVAIDGNCIFEDLIAYLGEGAYDWFTSMDGVEFELEDDEDEEYFVWDIKWEV